MTAPDPAAIRDAADRADTLRQNATPGPWVLNTTTVEQDGITLDYYFVTATAPDRVVAEVDADNPDARLIAATPELLSVLVPAARIAADLRELLEAQIKGGPPKLPDTWTRSEVAHYRNGWLDAMQRIDDSIVSVEYATGGAMGTNWRERAEDRWVKSQAEHERLREAMSSLLAAVTNEGVEDCSLDDLHSSADVLDAQGFNLHAAWVRRIADAAAAARGERTDG